VIIINDEIYSIGKVCELLNIEIFNLRYIEKTTGLEIKRNNAGERIYSQTDLETLKFIIKLKSQGLNYKAIKKVLEHKEKIVTDSIENEDGESLIIQNGKSQKFMSMIKDTIDKSIESKVNSKLERITSSIETLVKQNQELKQSLEIEQEKHFNELDRKLTKWRENQEEKNKPWFKKIFK